MRSFVMINSNGTEWDLTDTSSFLSDPEGLGFEADNKYTTYGNAFVLGQRQYKQPEPKGKINFDGYKQYHDFCLFLQYRPLKLKYTAYKTIYMDVEVKALKKGELNEFGRLECEASFSGLTLWYQKLEVVNNKAATGGKKYSYAYDYTYIDTDSGVVSIESDSNTAGGIKLTIMGPLTNPTWEQTVNGSVITKGSFLEDVSIASGHRLVIDSTGPQCTITEQDSYGNTVTDLYQKSNFSVSRFMYLKPGTNIISAAHAGTIAISMSVEAHVTYASL